MYLLRLPPILAGTIVMFLVFFGTTIQGLALSPIARQAAILVVMLVVVGWPTMLVERLSTQAHDRPNRIVFRTAVVAVLLCHAVFIPFLSAGAATGPIDEGAIAMLVIMLCGLLAPLYVFWSAARVLVSLEERESVRWDRCVGTFLLFWFLPLGIFFLQGRVRRLCSAASASSSLD